MRETSQIVGKQAAAAESSDQTRKKTSMGERTLPEDLMSSEILPRIPAKYILRHRLVCKSWNSVFSTPAFVNSHLTHQLHNNSEENDRIITINGFHNNSEVKRGGLIEGVDILSHIDSVRVRKVPCACDTLCGSVNGLVLMVSKPEKRFCLWNPAIGQVKLFDFPAPHLHLKNNGYYVAGFCWDHVQNDYKALMFCYDSISSPARQICIYSTNSATWTSLCIPQNLMLPGLRDYFWMLLGHSTIVKGTPYWSCSKSLTFPGEKHVLKVFRTFKFVPEINELRTLPDLDSLKCCGDTFSIVNIKDRLVGMTYNSVTHGGTNMVDMYSLDNEESGSGVWSKMHIIGPVNFGYNQRLLHAFRNGGEILIGGDSGTFACYDPKTKEIKSIVGTTSTRLSFRKFVGSRYSYTPSLVRVRGMKSIQNFSTKGELKEFAL
ncbi:F-box protein At5g42460-like [Daucus carota subsp. sativus]|uniref:F-box protein At5g42460-like n=1 Tax=Daucus carota subsp. sativus TaxID=79200 RepID=UPI003082A0DE